MFEIFCKKYGLLCLRTNHSAFYLYKETCVGLCSTLVMCMHDHIMSVVNVW